MTTSGEAQATLGYFDIMLARALEGSEAHLRADYERAMKFMSMKGWRKSEPVQLGAPGRPALLEKAVEALIQAGMSVRAVAEEANLPPELVEQIIGASTERRPRVQI